MQLAQIRFITTVCAWLVVALSPVAIGLIRSLSSRMTLPMMTLSSFARA
ncbi:hypothetical protein [Nostoc sp.]